MSFNSIVLIFVFALTFVCGCSSENSKMQELEKATSKQSISECDLGIPKQGVIRDYEWAIEPLDYKSKKRRLLVYLAYYSPEYGFEDSPHIRFYSFAQYELVKAHYNLGEYNDADNLIEKLKEDLLK